MLLREGVGEPLMRALPLTKPLPCYLMIKFGLERSECRPDKAKIAEPAQWTTVHEQARRFSTQYGQMQQLYTEFQGSKPIPRNITLVTVCTAFSNCISLSA